jgi:hypothetical protein
MNVLESIKKPAVLATAVIVVAVGAVTSLFSARGNALEALKAPNEADVESRINLVAEVARIQGRFKAIEQIQSIDEANGVAPKNTAARLDSEVSQLNSRLATIDQMTTIEDRDISEQGIVTKHVTELAKARSKGTNIFAQLQHEIKTYVYLTEHYDDANRESSHTSTKSLRLKVCTKAIGSLLSHQDTADAYLDNKIADMVGKAYDAYNVEILGLVLSGEKPNEAKVAQVTKDLVDLGYTAKHNQTAQAAR